MPRCSCIIWSMYQWLNIAVSLYRCRCINLCFARVNFRSERDKWKCQCHPKAKGKVTQDATDEGETTKISQRWTKFLFPFQKSPSMSHVASDYLRLNYRVTKWPFCMWSPRGWPRATACETRWNSCAITRASWPSFPTLQICYFLFPCSLIHLVPYLSLVLDFPYIMFGRVSIAFVFTFTPFCVGNFLDIFFSSCNILQCHMPILNPYPKNMYRNPSKPYLLIPPQKTRNTAKYIRPNRQTQNERRHPNMAP